MDIGILGTGIVGKTIGSALVAKGHQVRLGSRATDNAAGREWVLAAGTNGSHGTFADAAEFGDVVFSCTSGSGAVAAVRSTGSALAGKIVIDVSNPLDFSNGMPPSLTISNTDSLGEALQREFPAVRFVKALNTVTCALMVNPAALPGRHDVFVAGNDPAARAEVAGYLRDWFGWDAPIDLGDMTAARGLEAWLHLWIRMYGTFGNANFNVHVNRG